MARLDHGDDTVQLGIAGSTGITCMLTRVYRMDHRAGTNTVYMVWVEPPA